MNLRPVFEALAPNSVSRFCAVVSMSSIILPWLLLSDCVIHARLGIMTSYPSPFPSYSLAEVVGAWAFDFGPYSDAVLPLVSVASILFVAGAVTSWWSPIGGAVQMVSTYTLAFSLAQNEYNLFHGELIEAEYALGIGFHIGFVAALVTVFSLCPSGRAALMKAFRRTFIKTRPKLS